MTATKTKRSGLAAFTKRPASSPTIPVNGERQRRGQGDQVAITVRLSKNNWMKLRNLAMMEGETLQTLAVNGFNRELAAKGLPPLEV